MITLTETITVPRSAADCLRYLADFSTTAQWDPGVLSARKLSPGAVAPGSQFEVEVKTPRGALAMHYSLDELDPDHGLIRLSGRAEGLEVIDRIQVEAVSQHECRIRYQADMRFSGLASLTEPALAPWLRRMGRTSVASLATALSDPPAPRAPRRLDRIKSRLLLPAMRDFTRAGYRAMPDRGLSRFIDGQHVAITGPTSGLGLASACELARLGARLSLIGRDATRLSQARDAIMDFSGCPASHIRVHEVELSDLAAVRALAHELAASDEPLDVLINNAGVLLHRHERSVDGHELALAVNLLAPWLLGEILLPKLRASGGRMINVLSGGLYTQGLKLSDMQFETEAYDGAKAYARHKRALLALTRHWAGQPDNAGVGIHAMHPGWAATPGVARSLPGFERRLGKRLRDARMGADTICWLASSRALAGRSGEFWFDRRPQISAILPGTEVSPMQQRRLLSWLHENAPTNA